MPGSASYSSRSEQAQRVPSGTPRLADLCSGVEDQEVRSLAGQVVGDGESCLAAADDDDVEGL